MNDVLYTQHQLIQSSLLLASISFSINQITITIFLHGLAWVDVMCELQAPMANPTNSKNGILHQSTPNYTLLWGRCAPYIFCVQTWDL